MNNVQLRITDYTYRPTSVAAAPAATYSLLPVTYSLNYSFSAKERDAETGLSYFGARYYSSDLSLWLSVDPMSDKYPSTSPYAYCRNNPIVLVDPNGMFDTKSEARQYRREHHTGGRIRKNSQKDKFAGTFSIDNKREGISYTKPQYEESDASIIMHGLSSDGVVKSPIAHDSRTRREKMEDLDTRFTNGSVDLLQGFYVALVSPINDGCMLITNHDIYGNPNTKSDKKWAIIGLITFGSDKSLKTIRYFGKVKNTKKFDSLLDHIEGVGYYLDYTSGRSTVKKTKKNNTNE